MQSTRFGSVEVSVQVRITRPFMNYLIAFLAFLPLIVMLALLIWLKLAKRREIKRVLKEIRSTKKVYRLLAE